MSDVVRHAIDRELEFADLAERRAAARAIGEMRIAGDMDIAEVTRLFEEAAVMPELADEGYRMGKSVSRPGTRNVPDTSDRTRRRGNNGW